MHLRPGKNSVDPLVSLSDADTQVRYRGEFRSRPVPQLSVMTFAVILVLWWATTSFSASSDWRAHAV